MLKCLLICSIIDTVTFLAIRALVSSLLSSVVARVPTIRHLRITAFDLLMLRLYLFLFVLTSIVVKLDFFCGFSCVLLHYYCFLMQGILCDAYLVHGRYPLSCISIFAISLYCN